MGFITKSFQTPAFEACLADFVSLQLPQLHSGAPISYYPFVTRYPKSDYEPERSGKRVIVARPESDSQGPATEEKLPVLH